MSFLKKNRVFLICAALTAASFFLHVWNIGTPARPVFDEAHFSTYAAKDVLREPYFDIHPPLGKFVFSLPLFSYDKDILSEVNFVKIFRNEKTGFLDTSYAPADFKNFPYVDLRIMSVLFGIALLLGVFLFTREVAGEYAALLALFLLIFENALLLHTRLILLDGMYLALGFWALYFFFRKNPLYFWGGIFLGLALSVKITAIIFLGPVLIAWFLSDEKWDKKKDALKFLFVGIVTLLIIWFFANILIFPIGERAAFFENLLNIKIGSSFWTPVVLFLREVVASVFGYTSGAGPNPMMSPWYLWPLMLKPMFYNESGLSLALVGNAFVWYIGTFSVIAGISILVKNAFKKIDASFLKPALIFLGGYVFSLIPFFTVIRRATFLYHYFPALIFSVCLASFLITEYLKDKPGKIKIAALSAIVILTIIGFTISAPFTYGL
ncbi:MAG: phospholipid carrier-dependent glycosyltransferase [Minisyncoccia bacterium]